MEWFGFRFLHDIANSFRAPQEPNLESSDSVRVQLPACHSKLLATEMPKASALERNGILGLSKIGLQAEKTPLALTMRCASAAPE